MKQRKPYKLREYQKEDWTDPAKFLMNAKGKASKCRICGHHLPVDQVVQVGSDFIHSDNTICLALVNKSGIKENIDAKDERLEVDESISKTYLGNPVSRYTNMIHRERGSPERLEVDVDKETS